MANLDPTVYSMVDWGRYQEEMDVNISIMKIDRVTEFASSIRRQQLIRQKSVSKPARTHSLRCFKWKKINYSETTDQWSNSIIENPGNSSRIDFYRRFFDIDPAAPVPSAEIGIRSQLYCWKKLNDINWNCDSQSLQSATKNIRERAKRN